MYFQGNCRSSVWLFILTLSPMGATLLLPTASLAQSTNPASPASPEQVQPTILPPIEPSLTLPSTAPIQPSERPDSIQTITVEGFEFDGATVFSSTELEQVITEYVGKQLTFDELLQVADAITQHYVQEGYITSGAYIPAQALSEGIVKIQVLEGRIADINVDIRKSRLNRSYVRDRLSFRANQPLKIDRLREKLQLLQRDPLIESINADLTVGTQPGTNSLNVTVVGANTLDVRPSLNNNRNSSVGTFERGIEISEANLSGRGDKITAAYRNTDGSNRYEFGYTAPINSQNGSLSFFTRITDNRILEPSFDGLDIDVDTREFNLSYRQPIIQKANAKSSQELALSLTASRLESDSELVSAQFGRVGFPLFAGADSNGETRVSAVRLGQEWVKRTSKDVLSARSQLSLGVDVLGATSNVDAPDSNFFAWRGQLQYLRRLGKVSGNPSVGPTLLLRSDLQLTPDSLLSLEQFSVGGQASVRGYRQDALLADNGFQASAEARIPIFRVSKWNSVLQLAPFFDVGTAWNTVGASPSSNVLAGTGLGVIWETGNNFRARFDWGIPLIEVEDANTGTLQESGFYFQLEFSPF